MAELKDIEPFTLKRNPVLLLFIEADGR